MGFQASTVVECTPDLVWAVMTDWSKAPYWLGIQGLRPEDPKTALGEGSRLTYTARGTQVSTIRQWEPDRLLALESTQAGVTAHYTYQLTEQDGATLVELKAECTAQGPVWKFLLPAISFIMERTDRRQLVALKRLTETIVRVAERQADALEELEKK